MNLVEGYGMIWEDDGLCDTYTQLVGRTPCGETSNQVRSSSHPRHKSSSAIGRAAAVVDLWLDFNLVELLRRGVQDVVTSRMG